MSDQKLNALRALVLSVLRHRGWVPEADLEHAVAEGYTQRHVLDVLTIVALKSLSNYVNHIAHTPLDPQFSSQAWSAKGTTDASR